MFGLRGEYAQEAMYGMGQMSWSCMIVLLTVLLGVSVGRTKAFAVPAKITWTEKHTFSQLVQWRYIGPAGSTKQARGFAEIGFGELVGEEDIATFVSSQSSEKGRVVGYFSQRTSRVRFVQRVFMIVLGQLLTTATTTYYMLQNKNVPTFLLLRGRPILALLILVSLLIAQMLISSPMLRNTEPYNLLLLFFFTLCQSITMGTLSSLYPPKAVLAGSGHTIMAVFAVLLYSTQPNPSYDLTYIGNGLLAALTSVFVGTIANSYFGISILDNLLLGLSTALFVVYLAYDLQRIVSNKSKKKYQEDDYILAALSLYEDIIGLLTRMIRIASKVSSEHEGAN